MLSRWESFTHRGRVPVHRRLTSRLIQWKIFWSTETTQSVLSNCTTHIKWPQQGLHSNLPVTGLTLMTTEPCDPHKQAHHQIPVTHTIQESFYKVSIWKKNITLARLNFFVLIQQKNIHSLFFVMVIAALHHQFETCLFLICNWCFGQ